MRLTIGAKIFAGFLLVMLLFVGVSAFALTRLAQISHRLSEGPLQLQLALKIADLDKTQQQLSRVVSTGRDKTTYWRKARMQTLGEARSLARRSGLPGVAPRIATLVLRVEENERAYAALEAEIGPGPDEGSAANAAGRAIARAATGSAAGPAAGMERREEMLSHDVRTLRLDVEEQTGQIAIEIDREGRRLLYLVLVLVVLATLLGAIVTFGAHAALRPLGGLTRHAYALGSGDYSLRIAVRGRDEIAELGSAFNAMAQALEQREQQVIRSERLAAVGRMAAQVAHEIRNPLSSIGLNVELLEEEVAAQTDAAPRAPAMASSLQAISKEVDRLTEITEQYLRLARLPTPKREAEDLAEIVKALVEFYRPECSRKNIEIALEASPVTVQADENQIRQALLNLLRNAAEAMPEGGRISVSVGEAAGGALVKIADQGPGIAPEQRHRIFEPFFSTKQGGTGLGLALAHEIARQHGGSLTVEGKSSPGPGKGEADGDGRPRGQAVATRGATFVLQLPGGRAATPGSAGKGPGNGDAEGESVPPGGPPVSASSLL